MQTYERKLKPEEVLVVLRNCLNSSSDMSENLELYGRQYGYLFRVENTLLSQVSNDCECLHLIWLDKWSQWGAIRDQIELTLYNYASVSIALEYASDAEFINSKEVIEKTKHTFDDRVNFLMPVRSENGQWTVPVQKILDNAVCDTVRIKYKPVHRSEQLPLLKYDEMAYFTEVRRMFAQYDLYFRAPTDGYVALRRSQGNEFLITATKTNKLEISPERVSIVHSYDRNENTLEYSGRYLPSSDAVEAAIIFQNHSDIVGIIHTHASNLFTRNFNYANRILVPSLPYGTPTLGDAISQSIFSNRPDWLIMEDHGELFFGPDGSSAITTLRVACGTSKIGDVVGGLNG